MLRARLLVWWWWLAVARALPVSDQTASDWAWGWWEYLPYLAWTEAEPPLIVLEDAPRASPRPHAPPADLHKAVTEELQRNAEEALERIGYWDAPPRGATPSPSPSPPGHYDQFEGWERHYVHYHEYDYDYVPLKRRPYPDVELSWGRL